MSQQQTELSLWEKLFPNQQQQSNSKNRSGTGTAAATTSSSCPSHIRILICGKNTNNNQKTKPNLVSNLISSFQNISTSLHEIRENLGAISVGKQNKNLSSSSSKQQRQQKHKHFHHHRDTTNSLLSEESYGLEFESIKISVPISDVENFDLNEISTTNKTTKTNLLIQQTESEDSYKYFPTQEIQIDFYSLDLPEMLSAILTNSQQQKRNIVQNFFIFTFELDEKNDFDFQEELKRWKTALNEVMKSKKSLNINNNNNVSCSSFLGDNNFLWNSIRKIFFENVVVDSRCTKEEYFKKVFFGEVFDEKATEIFLRNTSDNNNNSENENENSNLNFGSFPVMLCGIQEKEEEENNLSDLKFQLLRRIAIENSFGICKLTPDNNSSSKSKSQKETSSSSFFDSISSYVLFVSSLMMNHCSAASIQQQQQHKKQLSFVERIISESLLSRFYDYRQENENENKPKEKEHFFLLESLAPFSCRNHCSSSRSCDYWLPHSIDAIGFLSNKNARSLDIKFLKEQISELSKQTSTNMNKEVEEETENIVLTYSEFLNKLSGKTTISSAVDKKVVKLQQKGEGSSPKNKVSENEENDDVAWDEF